MTDPQLLDWFVSRQDEHAEAVFEEVVIRHGPMVFRVCLSVLHDANDADGAFQATFLVLAHRARSIRRHGSIASWLFGVAHRIASRAMSEASRRRARDTRVATRTNESFVPADIVIDRAGKIAFRSDMAADDRSVGGVFMRILTNPQSMTAEKANALVERAIAEEIDSVLECL